MKKYLKPLLAFGIIGLTVIAFTYYLVKHPQTVDQILDMPPLTLVLIVALYLGWFLALALVTRGSLRIYSKFMSRQENVLFNAYSTLINFFGPGQSGPIFRGAYLKKRHNLGIKPYMFTLLLYYGFYAVISVMFMFIGSRPWWQTMLLMIFVAAGSAVFIRWYKKRSKVETGSGFNLVNISWIFAATAAQLIIQAVIYGIELHNVGANASIGQVLAYTGVANFALFVALTPGAIGIREAFLLFSDKLHHISEGTIVAASVVDRASYLVFLGVLFVIVIALHAQDKLRVKELDLEKPAKS